MVWPLMEKGLPNWRGKSDRFSSEYHSMPLDNQAPLRLVTQVLTWALILELGHVIKIPEGSTSTWAEGLAADFPGAGAHKQGVPGHCHVDSRYQNVVAG